MFNNNFIVCIKVNNKVLRERGNEVMLPFGSEYSVSLKNLDTRTAVATISIDGSDISPGYQFIIRPQGTVDISRFVKNGNLKEGNALKFIERTETIEQHRGIKAQDGIVSVTFSFERPATPILQPNIWQNPDPLKWTNPPINPMYPTSTPLDEWNHYRTYCSNRTLDTQPLSNSICSQVATEAKYNNTAGITTPGSVTEQAFSIGYVQTLDTISHVISLRLVGDVEDQPITKPVTTKTKIKCVTCGKSNKSSAKFCSECGTSLVIV